MKSGRYELLVTVEKEKSVTHKEGEGRRREGKGVWAEDNCQYN